MSAKAEHDAGCTCTRCVGFQAGHELSVRHGAYADVRLGERVEELAATVRELVPAYSASDEIGVRVLCLALARLEQSAAAFGGDGLDAAELQRLRQDERGWANTVRRYLADFGLSPLARARLGLDLARTPAAAASALREYLAGRGAIEEASTDA